MCFMGARSPKLLGIRGIARTRAQARASIIQDTLIEQSDRDKSVSVFREAV